FLQHPSKHKTRVKISMLPRLQDNRHIAVAVDSIVLWRFSLWEEVEMSGFQGVRVSDQSLQNQFSQPQLRSLKSRFLRIKKDKGQVTVGDLPPLLMKLKPFNVIFKEDEIRDILCEPGTDAASKLDFDGFLRVII
ncbi:hypothetical protein M8C21_001248, partial [Ambrosia artemisiifolia]